MTMEIVDKIMSDSLFKKRLKEITEKEKDRIYCRHGLDHFLDVARTAYIDVLENGYDYSREMIYITALLHDIGRHSELEKDGLSHHEAGAIIAGEILSHIGCDRDKAELIQRVIRLHKYNECPRNSLEYIIYNADKKVRNCFVCAASDSCYWAENVKNQGIWR